MEPRNKVTRESHLIVLRVSPQAHIKTFRPLVYLSRAWICALEEGMVHQAWRSCGRSMHVVCNGGKLEDLKQILRNGEYIHWRPMWNLYIPQCHQVNKCHSESCLNTSFHHLHDVYFVFVGWYALCPCTNRGNTNMR